MANLFMNIGKGDNIWFSEYDAKTKKSIKYAPSSYQISVGTRSAPKYSGPHWEWYKFGWYQGCWFIENPMPDMLSSEFIKLMTDVGNIIRNKHETINSNCPAFTGDTFMDIYPKLTSCMDEIIRLLNEKTGNKNWHYRESYGKPSVKEKLIEADEFIAACV